jgi:hypothetical protein
MGAAMTDLTDALELATGGQLDEEALGSLMIEVAKSPNLEFIKVDAARISRFRDKLLSTTSILCRYFYLASRFLKPRRSEKSAGAKSTFDPAAIHGRWHDTHAGARHSPPDTPARLRSLEASADKACVEGYPGGGRL